MVPKLRFPEFQDAPAWKPVSLRKASVPVDEPVGERKLTPVSISAGIGFVPQAEKFGRDISGKQYQRYTLVRDGDFVFNKGNSLKFPQGCIYLLQGWGQVAAPNVFIAFRLKDGYSNAFFQNCFEQNQHGKQLQRHITSGARSNGLLNISKETFFNVEIPTPKLPEQQKIADCLDSADALIAAQGRKVEALRAHKKGLMQQLFPQEGETQPRLRFPEFQSLGAWRTSRLGKLIRLQSGFAFSSAYFGNEGKQLVTPKNFTKFGFGNFDDAISKFTSEKVAEKYVCVPGDLLILLTDLTPTCELLGKPLEIAEKDGDVLLNQRIAKVEPIADDAITSFLKQFFLSEAYNDVILRTASGSTVRHSSNKIILNMNITFPRLLEQRRIADCLTSLDDLIAAESRKLDTLKTHKKGLMQQLFPQVGEGDA